MTWFRVDDGFYDHPKVLAALEDRHGKGAIALWVRCGSWCGKQENNGEIPAAAARNFGGTRAEISLLLRVGLWVETVKGYAFNGWEERNPLRADLDKRREKNKEKVAKWRKEHPSNQVTNQLPGSPVTTPVTTLPDPTQTLPRPIEEKREESAQPAAAPALVLEPVAPKPPRKPDPAKAALREAMRESFHASNEAAPALSGGPEGKAASRLRELVELGRAASLPEAAQKLVAAARRSGKAFPWCLLDADLEGRPTGAWAGPRGALPCSTAAELGPAFDIEAEFGHVPQTLPEPRAVVGRR